jgi:hypothetical protein
MSMPIRALLPLAVAVFAIAGAPSHAAEATFAAQLTGGAILPEPVRTPASGELRLTVSPNGQSIAYVLTVEDLENASEADIHLGPAIANGPLVVKLFHAAAPKAGKFSGVLAEGKFGAADLLGPMKGATLQELLEEIRAGNAYVNVHTSDGTDPPNSGPGDYRVGEIRGQIK